MKKITLMLVTSFLVSAVIGQTGQGTVLAGGSIAFTSSKESDFKTTTFIIAPDIGYFFVRNFAGGVNISYTSISVNEMGNSGSSSIFSGGPFARYYFNTGEKTKIFAEGSAGWGSIKYGDTEPSTSTSTYGFRAGPAIFLNPHVALEFTAGYSTTKMKSNGEKSTTNTFALGAGFQIHLGK